MNRAPATRNGNAMPRAAYAVARETYILRESVVYRPRLGFLCRLDCVKELRGRELHLITRLHRLVVFVLRDAEIILRPA